MRRHRAYVSEIAETIRLSGREARHLIRVLRAGPGDEVTVFDGQGHEARTTIVEVGPTTVVLRLERRLAVERETEQPLTLYLALLKGDKLAEVIRAGTELGVHRFVLLATHHSVPKTISPGKLERLRRITVEAAKQSGRNHLPEISGPVALKAIPRVSQGLVAHPRTATRVGEVYDPSEPVALAVGPEGGFSDEEVEHLVDRGFTPVTLGRRILRAETAALALVALVTAGYGQ